MKIAVGQKAPSFTLTSVDKTKISLEDFKGKNVVIFFFPMAWTGVCTKEMCAVQEDYNAYSQIGAEVVGISTDSFFALKKFKEEFKLDGITLLSDFNKEAINAYDIVLNDFIVGVGYNGVAKRSTFVLDKEGVIQYIEVLPSPGDMPNMDAVKEALKKLQN